MSSPEWLTRKQRIDPRLDACGWRRVKGAAVADAPATGPCRIEELETVNGPADYALVRDGEVVGIVEAKKAALDPQEVLVQATRYARGIASERFKLDGLGACR